MKKSRWANAIDVASLLKDGGREIQWATHKSGKHELLNHLESFGQAIHIESELTLKKRGKRKERHCYRVNSRWI